MRALTFRKSTRDKLKGVGVGRVIGPSTAIHVECHACEIICDRTIDLARTKSVDLCALKRERLIGTRVRVV